MKLSFLLKPADLLFFRDAVPMSAGQGRGAGCRMPFPTTFHEALRTSLLMAADKLPSGKQVFGRPQSAPRKGSYQPGGTQIGSTAFQSLQTIGPLPFLDGGNLRKGLLLPVPLDVQFADGALFKDKLYAWKDALACPRESEKTFKPPCLPTPVREKKKEGGGWWTLDQYRIYLADSEHVGNNDLEPIPQQELWLAERRIGVRIDPGSFCAATGDLFLGMYLRPQLDLGFAAGATLKRPAEHERALLSSLDWILWGGERRLCHVDRFPNDPFLDPLFGKPPEPTSASGPCLLKWVLGTPAFFVHGSLPGWCAPAEGTADGKALGQVRLRGLKGRAFLVAWRLGKPLTYSGWDLSAGGAKPTQLAVSAGSVYYFLCEDSDTAEELASLLHWKPRSDFYGEKGCGYGLTSFRAEFHGASELTQNELWEKLLQKENMQ